MYNSLLSYGDLIPLKLTCNVQKLMLQVKGYEYLKYNPRKDIPRYGLSITSLKGELDGIDLDSIKEYNKENNTNYDELSFKEFTQVYHVSSEIQKIIKSLTSSSIGVLITDHNVRETLKVCDESYILSDGKVISFGKSKEIIKDSLVKKVYLGEDFRL